MYKGLLPPLSYSLLTKPSLRLIHQKNLQKCTVVSERSKSVSNFAMFDLRRFCKKSHSKLLFRSPSYTPCTVFLLTKHQKNLQQSPTRGGEHEKQKVRWNMSGQPQFRPRNAYDTLSQLFLLCFSHTIFAITKTLKETDERSMGSGDFKILHQTHGVRVSPDQMRSV
jgi:hypothetical protein